MEIELDPRKAGGGSLNRSQGGWRLEMPAGPSKTYRLAQLDDYARTTRRRFKHAPPLAFCLRARISRHGLPGTWGFGFWNDPFGLSVGFGGQAGRLPALPQAAWFMHASPPNWLSFRDSPTHAIDQVTPANGFFAGTYCSPSLPSLLFLPALIALPLLVIRPVSRLLRRLAGQLIRQEAVIISAEVTQWHEYTIHWLPGNCIFTVDGTEILKTSSSPHSPLGMVVWIDNQFAAWTPQGRLAYGTLENPAAWLEIEKLTLQCA